MFSIQIIKSKGIMKLLRLENDYFKTISTVMFPSWLKSRFPSALVALLWQAAFDFPNRLFHEFLSKNQANHNLPFVKYKMQELG